MHVLYHMEGKKSNSFAFFLSDEMDDTFKEYVKKRGMGCRESRFVRYHHFLVPPHRVRSLFKKCRGEITERDGLCVTACSLRAC
ncbi:hypothetical protein J6590_039239 [Homalodisca vitripennis]|nr:hypothetical protein J6590_039239 [Homalodisca vitripennis]